MCVCVCVCVCIYIYIWLCHESFIDTTNDFSNGSTCIVFTPSLTSTCVTSSSILKSLKRQESPAFMPCNWSHGYTRLDKSPEWGLISCPRSYCAVSSLLANMTEGHWRSNSRTVWKNRLVPIISTITDGLLLLRTMTPDIILLNMLSPPLKTPAGLLSRTKCTGRWIAMLCLQVLSKPSPAAVVTMLACLASALLVMNVPAVYMDRLLYDWQCLFSCI